MIAQGNMLDWCLDVNRLLREIRRKSRDALKHLRDKDKVAANTVKDYLKTEYSNLYRLWEERFPVTELGYLGRHIHFGEAHDYEDILSHDGPNVEQMSEKHLLEEQKDFKKIGFENLLHPVILQHAYQQYRNGRLRDAVLNPIIAVFDLVRLKTGLTEDGDRLVGQALSTHDPYLVLSELETESGRNDQTGFIQIFQGAYKGIRNPKAHSLGGNLTEEKAAEYLVFASLLARRIDEAHVVKQTRKKASLNAGGKRRRVP
jgi:uncharacterized protein (TIGR02391 family)